VNANPLYLNEVSADIVSLDKELLSSDGDEPSVTSKTTKRKVLVPAETKEIVKTKNAKSTSQKNDSFSKKKRILYRNNL